MSVHKSLLRLQEFLLLLIHVVRVQASKCLDLHVLIAKRNFKIVQASRYGELKLLERRFVNHAAGLLVLSFRVLVDKVAISWILFHNALVDLLDREGTTANPEDVYTDRSPDAGRLMEGPAFADRSRFGWENTSSEVPSFLRGLGSSPYIGLHLLVLWSYQAERNVLGGI